MTEFASDSPVVKLKAVKTISVAESHTSDKLLSPSSSTEGLFPQKQSRNYAIYQLSTRAGSPAYRQTETSTPGMTIR